MNETRNLKLDTGKSNVQAVKTFLREKEIKLVSEYTGGSESMTIFYKVKEDLLLARPAGGSPTIIKNRINKIE